MATLSLIYLQVNHGDLIVAYVSPLIISAKKKSLIGELYKGSDVFSKGLFISC